MPDPDSDTTSEPGSEPASAEPLSVKVLLTSGEGVRIDWKDGHKSAYSFPYLREQCPCATCRGHGPETGRRSPQPALPMYQGRIHATHAEALGNYAIQISFSDGHRTGIYSFEYLRRICPCEVCRKAAEK